jgi:hypothetical protein
MLYREIIAVCTQIRIKHINTLCGAECKISECYTWLVHVVTTELKMVRLGKQ